jgi:hypothetical protein
LSETVSIANLTCDTWTISNRTHNIVTESVWLADALRLHVRELGAAAESVQVSYQLDGVDIDSDVREVRETLQWLHQAYQDVKRCDATTRPTCYALLERLADNRVMPSEMTLMLGVETKIAERFAGSEHEARLSRMILHNLRAR